jgi:hypothetical protein
MTRYVAAYAAEIAAFVDRGRDGRADPPPARTG